MRQSPQKWKESKQLECRICTNWALNSTVYAIQLWKALIISQTNLEFKKVGLDNWWTRILSVPYVIAYESFYPQFSMRNQEKINSRNLTGEPQTIWSGEGRKAFDVWATEQLFTILKQNGFNKT